MSLPADDVLVLVAKAQLQFVVIDLVDGPADDVALRRLVRAAHWAGLGAIALATDAATDDRLIALGLDGVARPGGPVRIDGAEGLTVEVVGDVEEARRRSMTGARLVAIHVEPALLSLLTSFSASNAAPGGPEQLVLLPGMLSDASVFDLVVPALPGHVHCRPMRIDLDDSIAELAASVLAVAPPRFALAGHSLGAIVALEVWRRAPGRVTRLAFLNASARPPSEAQSDGWAQLLKRTEAGEFAAVAAEQAVINMGGRASGSLVEHCRRMAERIGPDGFVRQLSAQASRPDSRPSLCDIAVPTLVVSGTEDEVCPIELQQELVAGVPGA
ncbi:MAG: alpha/beta fold hydrolase, partial [Mycobacteriales bacterium]